MGLMDDLLGGGRTPQSTGEYVELDLDDAETAAAETRMRVHVAAIEGQQDVVAVKDAIYGGDVVIADLTRHSTADRTIERVIDELQEVTHEVGGDIVQKADDQLIVTPGGVAINRTKLGQ
jgi:SepF-like predicted cell division protein (DUF552 family)